MSSSGRTYFAYVCVPGVTSRSACSAARMVRRYASGVREIVERKRCPPDY